MDSDVFKIVSFYSFLNALFSSPIESLKFLGSIIVIELCLFHPTTGLPIEHLLWVVASIRLQATPGSLFAPTATPIDI